MIDVFFITAIATLLSQNSPLEDLQKYNSRCFGYYTTLDEAKEAVEENRCDIHETMYDFVVIEEIGPGIHAEATKELWFKYNPKKDSYEATEVRYIGFINHAIG